jgi:TolB protein
MSRRAVRFIVVIIAVGLLSAVLIPLTSRAAPGVAGVIAYERGNAIRLVDSDGGNDRLLWQEALPAGFKGIRGLQWRPDGGGLAFASDYQSTCSIYDSDLYTIRADGTGLKRITNSPRCADLAALAKGSVTLQIENAVANLSQFLVYVEGAATAQVVNIAPGAVVNVTIHNVADLGNFGQQPIAINGHYRWFDPALLVDVKPGQTVTAPARLVLRPSGNVYANMGATTPAWHRSGGKIGFLFYEGILSQIAANPPIGGPDGLLLAPGAGVIANALAWSPTDERIVYGDLNHISVVLPGAADGGTPLIDKSAAELILGLDWLPDGSGFIFAITDSLSQNSNLYEYNFAENSLTPITDFADDYAGGLSVSPNGQEIVFEFIDAIGDPSELWIIGRDGTGLRSLATLGESPDWQPGTGIEYTNWAYLPFQRR